jgi:hypothetical protein
MIKKQYFSMGELITIIAVLCLLAAVIIPGSNGARGRAKHATCKSNLKNIGTTVATYFADGTEILYPAIEDNLDGPVWTATIEVDPGIAKCPVKGISSYKKGTISAGDEYKGSATISLAVDPDNAHPKPPNKYVVYEDGHVANQVSP